MNVNQYIVDLPIWNFDGSSTGQATGENSDVLIKPVAIYPDPFRRGNNKLVMCETYDHTMKPLGVCASLCTHTTHFSDEHARKLRAGHGSSG
jgi:glutamine synthetase